MVGLDWIGLGFGVVSVESNGNFAMAVLLLANKDGHCDVMGSGVFIEAKDAATRVEGWCLRMGWDVGDVVGGCVALCVILNGLVDEVSQN